MSVIEEVSIARYREPTPDRRMGTFILPSDLGGIDFFIVHLCWSQAVGGLGEVTFYATRAELRELADAFIAHELALQEAERKVRS